MHKCYCFFCNLIFEVKCCFHKLLVVLKFIDSTSKRPEARSALNKLCSAIGWKYPTYDFEEQGPPDTKLFTCKVTVHVDTITDTVVECFSDPKPLMKAAQEQAAQGVLWCLKCLRHVK